MCASGQILFCHIAACHGVEEEKAASWRPFLWLKTQERRRGKRRRSTEHPLATIRAKVLMPKVNQVTIGIQTIRRLIPIWVHDYGSRPYRMPSCFLKISQCDDHQPCHCIEEIPNRCLRVVVGPLMLDQRVIVPPRRLLVLQPARKGREPQLKSRNRDDRLFDCGVSICQGDATVSNVQVLLFLRNIRGRKRLQQHVNFRTCRKK